MTRIAIVCLAAATVSAAAGEDAMIRLGGTPRQIGQIWGQINRRAVHRDLEISFLAKAAAEGLATDVLIERSRPFVRIAREIAPHWLAEAQAVARAAGVREDLYIAMLGCGPRNLFLHECTSYAVARSHARGGAILFHKNRDNVTREQSAFILESSLAGINKFIAVGDASAVTCAMMVNDKGLAGSADYPGALRPEKAEPQYAGLMNSSLLRHVAERAASCREALGLIQDLVAKGYYAGGKVNVTHWLFVDRQGVILEVSNNSRHVVWREHAEKVYFSMRETSRAADRLRAAVAPIDFHLFHNVARDPSICVKSSVSGMTVEIDPEQPAALTCAWVALPARSVAFPLLMGQTKTPACLLGGGAYLLGATSGGTRQSWEALETAAHAAKELLRAPGATAELLNQWSQRQAAVLLDRLQASPCREPAEPKEKP